MPRAKGIYKRSTFVEIERELSVKRSTVRNWLRNLKERPAKFTRIVVAKSTGNRIYFSTSKGVQEWCGQLDMALKVIQKKDPWLLKYPTVGIMGWDGKDSFKVIKRCKIKYRIPNNDWIALAKGMILKLSNYMKEQLKGSL